MSDEVSLYDWEAQKKLDLNNFWDYQKFRYQCDREYEHAYVAFNKNPVFAQIDKYVRIFEARQKMRQMQRDIEAKKANSNAEQK